MSTGTNKANPPRKTKPKAAIPTRPCRLPSCVRLRREDTPTATGCTCSSSRAEPGAGSKRLVIRGRRRELGLGSVTLVSLAERLGCGPANGGWIPARRSGSHVPGRRSRARHRHLSGLSPGAPTPDRAGVPPSRACASTASSRAPSRTERVCAGEGRPAGLQTLNGTAWPEELGSPSTRGDACSTRCADRVHRRRGAHRTRQHRGRLGQLPGSGIHPCQSGRRVRAACQRPGGRAPAPLTRRGRRRRSLLPARADRPGSGRARTLARPHATLEDQCRSDRSTCRLGRPPRRITPRVSRAVLATDPLGLWRSHRPAPGIGAGAVCWPPSTPSLAAPDSPI